MGVPLQHPIQSLSLFRKANGNKMTQAVAKRTWTVCGNVALVLTTLCAQIVVAAILYWDVASVALDTFSDGAVVINLDRNCSFGYGTFSSLSLSLSLFQKKKSSR
jgi:hypothetical protein